MYAAGIFDISGTTTSASITTLSGVTNSSVVLGAKTLTLSNASTTYYGVISGTNGALTLTAGTQTLTGTNTYTGATNINAGTLDVTGSIAASTLTSVNHGATLTGTGRVGNAEINAGGTFAPGIATVPGTSMAVDGNPRGVAVITLRRSAAARAKPLPYSPGASRSAVRGSSCSGLASLSPIMPSIGSRQSLQQGRQAKLASVTPNLSESISCRTSAASNFKN